MSETGLKRHFTGECAREIGRRLEDVLDGFDTEGYAAEVDRRVGPLELKDRVLVLSEGLRQRLPGDYPAAVAVLIDSLGPELAEDEGMFTSSWFLMPVVRFVEEYGLAHPRESLDAIYEITKRHTGEYAIRPYLQEHHEMTMAAVRAWARDPSHNVRRLASEGIRPRLPWAARFTPFVLDPGPAIEVLDLLIDDPSGYVRKSVANNLNDISKDHPDLAVDTARRWLQGSGSERTAWIARHGLRSLVKQGDGDALAALGSETDPSVTVDQVRLDRDSVRIGQSVTISADVINAGSRPRKVVVDYRMTLAGQSDAGRVFKLTTLQLAPGERATVTKKHPFRVLRSRGYRPGPATLQVQANGTPSARVPFVVREEAP